MFIPKVSQIIGIIKFTTNTLADVIDKSIAKAHVEINDFYKTIDSFQEKLKS